MSSLQFNTVHVCACPCALQVTAGGKAARGGVKEGDYVIAINRESAEEMLHFEAQQVIKAAGSSLQLKLST